MRRGHLEFEGFCSDLEGVKGENVCRVSERFGYVVRVLNWKTGL